MNSYGNEKLDLKALFADIDERAAVAFLEFERKMKENGLLPILPDIAPWIGETCHDFLRLGYLQGFKQAMHNTIKIAMEGRGGKEV